MLASASGQNLGSPMRRFRGSAAPVETAEPLQISTLRNATALGRIGNATCGVP